MADQSKELDGCEDPCAEFGATQRWAFVWMVFAIVFGSFLTYRLALQDRWMYDNNGEFLDYTSYKENRRTFSSLASDGVDPRKKSNLAALEKVLQD